MDNVNPIRTLDQDERLVAELYRLDVRHLSRLAPVQSSSAMQPAELLAALATHPQARFQASLILVFLRHPEFSAALHTALAHMSAPAADTFKLYYQAAAYLQRELEPEVRSRLKNWTPLPDFFSAELRLPPAESIGPGPRSSQAALRAVGDIHRQRSGWAFNWAESYRHYVPFLLKHLEAPDGHLDTRTTHPLPDRIRTPLP
jgi:hypothetical protein